LNESVKEGYPLKDVILPLLARLVWTVAGRYRHAAHNYKHWWRVLFRFINIDDLECPWTPKRKFFSCFCDFGLRHIL